MAERSGGALTERPIRLVAVDVDGTLLDSGHRVSAANAAAVRAARAAGVRVVLVTARPPIALRRVLIELDGADPEVGASHGAPGSALGQVFVASQGALTGARRPDGTLAILDRHPMPAATARVCAASAPPGVAVQWYAGDGWLVERMDRMVQQESDIVGAAPTVGSFATAPDPDKLLLLAPAEQTWLLDAVDVPPGLAAVRSTATHLEVTAAGVDKVHALAALAERWGIGPAEVAAIGDGPNDLPMLRFAGTSIAPANAAGEVRAAVDLVVASNDHDAVAEALARLLG